MSPFLPGRKITPQQREKILKLLRSDDPPTASDLAKRFGIHNSAITKIKREGEQEKSDTVGARGQAG